MFHKFLSRLRAMGALSPFPLQTAGWGRALGLYAGTVGIVALTLRRTDLGSALELALLSGVGGAILGGLWAGAGIAAESEEWRSRRHLAPRWPLRWTLAQWGRHIGPILTAGCVGMAGFLVWGRLVGVGWLPILETHLVLLPVLFVSVGWGWGWCVWIKGDRLAVAFGLLTWTPLLTGFAWIPALMPDSGKWLEVALNLTPVSGILSALGKQNVLWNPLFYGRLPYADYAVGFWKASAHAVLWSGVAGATGLLGVGIASWRNRRGSR